MQERSNKYFIYDNPRDINIRYYIRNLFLRMQAIIYKIFMNMVIPKKKNIILQYVPFLKMRQNI